MGKYIPVDIYWFFRFTLVNDIFLETSVETALLGFFKPLKYSRNDTFI